jgi:hypothetical protein
MTESRRDYLREGGTQRARRIGSGVGLHPQIAADHTGDMAELVDQGTLLCRDQQQQETQCFDHVSHSVPAQPKRYINANRIPRKVHNLWRARDRIPATASARARQIERAC